MPKELANPYVVNFLEFYPHDTLGKDIVAMYQSQKMARGPLKGI